MKTIKAITTALFLAVSMGAQADRTVVAKVKNGSTDKMQLSRRIVLDLTKEKPVLRYNTGSTIYNPDNEIIIQMEDMTDAIKDMEKDRSEKGALYDLSGRKVSKQNVKGIYIQDGKKKIVK